MNTKSFTCPPNVWTKIGDVSTTFIVQTAEAEAVRLHFGEVSPDVDTQDYLMSLEYDPHMLPFRFPEYGSLFIMPNEDKSVRIVAVTR